MAEHELTTRQNGQQPGALSSATLSVSKHLGRLGSQGEESTGSGALRALAKGVGVVGHYLDARNPGGARRLSPGSTGRGLAVAAVTVAVAAAVAISVGRRRQP
jgi:hypothetical protein